MDDDLEDILLDITNEKADIKTKLSIFSYFLRVEKINHEEEINNLLDRYNYLSELEKKVKEIIKSDNFRK